MLAAGTITKSGLKADAKIFDEFIFDVNTSYFDERGGYDYAVKFYEEAYNMAVKEIGGEQYILSAVMHAERRCIVIRQFVIAYNHSLQSGITAARLPACFMIYTAILSVTFPKPKLGTPKPEFKLFINTNHPPHTADDTVFTSGRVKIIPLDRHFSEQEQETGLKKYFQRRDNKSAILNWLVKGYGLLLEVGFDTPPHLNATIEAYRSEADIMSVFLLEYTEAKEDGRIPTGELYALYAEWSTANGYKPLSNRSFTIDIHSRYEIRHTGTDGRVVIGIALKN